MRSADAADFAAPDAAAACAALRAWQTARDAVLRGLVHALSNRVGTVVAAGGLLEAGSAEVAGRVLGGEAERLEALLAQFRLITSDPFGDEAAPEPLILGEVVGDAITLHAYAAEARGAAVTSAGVDAAPPVLVSRAGLLHALLVLLAGVGDEAVVLRADVGPGGEVHVRIDPPSGGEAPVAAGWLAARWLLTGSGGGGNADGALLLQQLGGARNR